MIPTPLEVKIISDKLGLLPILNIIIFLSTLGVALYNTRYTAKRNRQNDNYREVLRLGSINEYWYRSVFLENFISSIMDLENQILNVIDEVEPGMLRKREITKVTKLIIDIIYIRVVDPKLERELVKISETYESKIRTFSLNKDIVEDDFLEMTKKYKQDIISTLYDYEKNNYQVI